MKEYTLIRFDNGHMLQIAEFDDVGNCIAVRYVDCVLPHSREAGEPWAIPAEGQN